MAGLILCCVAEASQHLSCSYRVEIMERSKLKQRKNIKSSCFFCISKTWLPPLVSPHGIASPSPPFQAKPSNLVGVFSRIGGWRAWLGASPILKFRERDGTHGALRLGTH